MALVPAICTQCGAQIEVDDTKEAGICQHCGTAFITEKVINNYVVNNTITVENASINVSGVNIENLLKRAIEYENAGDTEKALEYFDRVLDEDFDNEVARAHIKDIKTPKTIDISGFTFPYEKANEIIGCLGRGEKVQAIKLFREATGWGLKEAKDAIDSYELKNQDYLRTIKAASNNAPQNMSNNVKCNTNSSTTKSGGCYIATCVYGSYDCPEVWTLRRFRDYTLDETWYGRLFIKCYYAISPTLVKWFGNKRWFRTFWKCRLDAMVEKLNRRGIEDSQYSDKY